MPKKTPKPPSDKMASTASKAMRTGTGTRKDIASMGGRLEEERALAKKKTPGK